MKDSTHRVFARLEPEFGAQQPRVNELIIQKHFRFRIAHGETQRREMRAALRQPDFGFVPRGLGVVKIETPVLRGIPVATQLHLDGSKACCNVRVLPESPRLREGRVGRFEILLPVLSEAQVHQRRYVGGCRRARITGTRRFGRALSQGQSTAKRYGNQRKDQANESNAKARTQHCSLFGQT